MRLILGLTLALLLAACAPPAPETALRGASVPSDLPPMRLFSTPRVSRPERSNAEIAQDFLDLSFALESGRVLPVFTRFEEPVTLRVTGPVPPSLEVDLARLLARLRAEAGIAIRRVPASGPASITVQTVPRARLSGVVPEAACFVVPRISSWEEFVADRRNPLTDWTTLERRDRLSIFIPGDVPPQEVRDCLHEELAQSLGPLNDLYRLPDSVFNDDNFHTVLTGFDMLILRATYARELQSGMSRAEVAARLPRILARLNPGGERVPVRSRAPTSRAWIDQIERALGPRGSPSSRRTAARRAVRIATDAGWNDNRLGFSYFALGRLSIGTEPNLALTSFLKAASLYASDPATKVHEAHIAMQLAAFALSSGQAEGALAIVDANTDAVMAAENASLLATLLLVKGEALRLLGRDAEARRLRTEGIGWARYGFGTDEDVRRRLDEIAAISPLNRTGGPS